MLDITFILIFILAIIFLLVGIELEGTHDYWFPICIGFSAVCWFSLAFGVMDIEIPYQMYNVSSSQIETGYQVHGTDYSLSYFFMGMGVLSVVYFFVHLFDRLGLISLDLIRSRYKRRKW